MGAGHRIAIVATPLVAIATLTVGLRIGARHAELAAIVYGAPRARAESAFAWQVVTVLDDRGVRETQPVRAVSVRARAANGREATWTGDTNEDGVAEARLDLPGVERGDAIDVEVRAPGLVEPLAKGRVAWSDAAWTDEHPSPFVRPGKREGKIALDVAILGGKLIAQHPVPLLVRATSRDDGYALGGVTVEAEPEPGLDVAGAMPATCALGWAGTLASPQMYVATLSLHARLPDGRTGDWFGAVPVATGAMSASIRDTVKAGAPITFNVAGSTTAYVEIDDEQGRAFAQTSPAPTTRGGFAPFVAPPLAPGLKWLVVSSEPRGAEALEGGTLARPFLVAGDPMPPGAPPANDACAIDAYLALHPAAGFRRWIALDGFAGRAEGNATRRQRGLAIALGALAVASVLELLLLLGAARRARADVRRTADALDAEGAAALTSRSGLGLGGVVIGVLIALLGFALLAALLLARG